MLRKWSTRPFGLILMQVTFALTATRACLADSDDTYQIKFVPKDRKCKTFWRIYMAADECMSVEQIMLNNSLALDTEGNCLELWTKPDCAGDVRYYVTSDDKGLENVSWDDFKPKSMKLCDLGKQQYHRIVRRGLEENTPEYDFWTFLSKIRGRLQIFLEEFRKGGGHPDWEVILGGRNWQGPRSKMYLKALYKVVNIFKTYCDMDMKWSRYTTKELAQIKQLSADVVKYRKIKAQKFPHGDPRSKIHAKIVNIWTNITITLNRAHELKTRYDESVKSSKSSNRLDPMTTIRLNVTSGKSSSTTTTKRLELTTDDETTPVVLTSSTSKKSIFVSVKNDHSSSDDESFVRIIE